jgi:N-dimethylarginine dimethylaminohydrolase
MQVQDTALEGDGCVTLFLWAATFWISLSQSTREGHEEFSKIVESCSTSKVLACLERALRLGDLHAFLRTDTTE